MHSNASKVLYSLQENLSKDNILKLIDQYDIETVELALLKFPGYEYIFNDALYELKQKRNQQFMRKQIIQRDKSCVLTNAHSDCCDIAHIKSFSNCNDNFEEKYDIKNGILLRSDLHKLFDLHLWTIHPITKKIILSVKCKNDTSYGMEQYDNNIIDIDLGREYLEYRYNEFMKS
jgi:hypothetical protein